MNEIYSPNDVETQITALQNRFGRPSYLQSEPRRRSRYSDCLRAGRPRGRSSSLGRVKNFHLFMSSRPALGPTQPPIQWVQGALSLGVKQQGLEADHLPSNYCRGQENVDL
jgi:hypothetical protein